MSPQPERLDRSALWGARDVTIRFVDGRVLSGTVLRALDDAETLTFQPWGCLPREVSIGDIRACSVIMTSPSWEKVRRIGREQREMEGRR